MVSCCLFSNSSLTWKMQFRFKLLGFESQGSTRSDAGARHLGQRGQRSPVRGRLPSLSHHPPHTGRKVFRLCAPLLQLAHGWTRQLVKDLAHKHGWISFQMTVSWVWGQTVFPCSQMRDEFVNADFCTIIFDEFFFSLLSNENTIRHLLRLLWFVHNKISNNRWWFCSCFRISDLENYFAQSVRNKLTFASSCTAKPNLKKESQ